MKPGYIAVFTVLLIVVLDQWLKLWVKANYMLHSEIAEFGFFRLYFIENNGMAFGWAFGDVWGKIALSVFRVIAVTGIGFIIRNLVINKAPLGLVICSALIMAGAMGNIFDSAFYGLLFSESYPNVATFMPEGGGYANFLMGDVVDMFHAELFWPDWWPDFLVFSDNREVFPFIFNLADAAITGGVIVLILFNKRFFPNGDYSIFKKKKVAETVEQS
jgi:signal peptidase II